MQHLERIAAIANSLCKRNGVFGADAEDFLSDVRLRLLEDDYGIIRKHRGASSMTTFLTVVIGNMFRDFRVKMWGKWRPSAEARRLGDTAVLLETAMYRDGLTLEQACTHVEQTGGVAIDRRALQKMAAALPARPRRRTEGEQALAEVPAAGEADGDVLERERQAQRESLHAALSRRLAALGDEDQLIIR